MRETGSMVDFSNDFNIVIPVVFEIGNWFSKMFTQAAEILLTAKHIHAPEAKEIGLVGHVVPDGKALERAREIAEVICANGPLAVAAITRTLHECDGMELDEALRHEWSYGQQVFASEDAKEGPLAFAQKRKPEFKGR